MTHAFWLGLIVGGAAWAIGGLVVDRVTAWAFGLSERVWHYRHVIRFRAAQGESLDRGWKPGDVVEGPDCFGEKEGRDWRFDPAVVRARIRFEPKKSELASVVEARLDVAAARIDSIRRRRTS